MGITWKSGYPHILMVFIVPHSKKEKKGTPNTLLIDGVTMKELALNWKEADEYWRSGFGMNLKLNPERLVQAKQMKRLPRYTPYKSERNLR